MQNTKERFDQWLNALTRIETTAFARLMKSFSAAQVTQVRIFLERYREKHQLPYPFVHPGPKCRVWVEWESHHAGQAAGSEWQIRLALDFGNRRFELFGTNYRTGAQHRVRGRFHSVTGQVIEARLDQMFHTIFPGFFNPAAPERRLFAKKALPCPSHISSVPGS